MAWVELIVFQVMEASSTTASSVSLPAAAELALVGPLEAQLNCFDVTPKRTFVQAIYAYDDYELMVGG